MTPPHITNGPKWRTSGSPSYDNLCVACADEREQVDRDTRLCRPCWRAWRFGDSLEAKAGRLVWTELAGTWHKRSGTALDFCEFGPYLLDLAGGVQRLLAEWERKP